MSIAKICRLLACRSASPSNRVAPTPPEQAVPPPVVAPKPVRLAFSHQHNPTMAEVLEFIREDPVIERKPTLRRY